MTKQTTTMTLSAADARLLKRRLESTANRERKPTHDFGTPPEPARAIVEALDTVSGNWVLEPSCGAGNLIQALLALLDERNVGQPAEDAMTLNIDAVELDEINAVIASDIRHAFATVNVHHANFLTWEAPRTYQRILMNPPFNGAECIKHFKKAVSLLSKPFGQIVCVLPKTQLRHLSLRELIGSWAHEVWELPLDQFKAVGVNKIETVCVAMSVGDAHNMHRPNAAYGDPRITNALHHVLITESSNHDLFRLRQELVKDLVKLISEDALNHARRHVRRLEAEITRQYLPVWHLNNAEIEAYLAYVLARDECDPHVLKPERVCAEEAGQDSTLHALEVLLEN